MIYKIIFAKLNFKSKLFFMSTTKFLFDRLFIKDLINIDQKYLFAINNNIIAQTKFSNIRSLNIFNNTHITNISKLKILHGVNSKTNINQHTIISANLYDIQIIGSPKIIDVSHMTNLRILTASGFYCGITQECINKLYLLIELNIENNPHITNIGHLVYLKKLNISGYQCRITQKNIMTLNLVSLDCSSNYRIVDVMHMSNLKILFCNSFSGICQKCISGLNLVELHLDHNNKITDVGHMSKLKKLYVCGEFCGINQLSIAKLDLVLLSVIGNKKIISVAHMTKLQFLYTDRPIIYTGYLKKVSSMGYLYEKN